MSGGLAGKPAKRVVMDRDLVAPGNPDFVRCRPTDGWLGQQNRVEHPGRPRLDHDVDGNDRLCEVRADLLRERGVHHHDRALHRVGEQVEEPIDHRDASHWHQQLRTIGAEPGAQPCGWNHEHTRSHLTGRSAGADSEAYASGAGSTCGGRNR
jgi:hypothetical protein